jgi:hypothetical protein
MRDLSQGEFRQQITFLRRQFLQEGDLPFRDVLSEELVQEALTTVRVVTGMNRIRADSPGLAQAFQQRQRCLLWWPQHANWR